MKIFKKIVYILIAVLLLSAGLSIHKWGVHGAQYHLSHLPSYVIKYSAKTPTIDWDTSLPAQQGFDPGQLERFGAELAKDRTDELLIIRHNFIVYERYSENYSPNKRHYLASAAKPIVGGMILAALLDEGKIRLDDHAAKFIHQWKNDPLKSKITAQQLASHSSGMIDIPFDISQNVAWKKEYVKNHGIRFDMALNRVPIVREPGSFYSYSGVGYYALAYIFSSVLKDSNRSDVRNFYRTKIMQPLGVPDSAWTISYRESYSLDGLTLYACGSGANFTARALGRIGQLLLNKGRWGNKQILSPSVVRELLSRPCFEGKPLQCKGVLPRGIGWKLNVDGFFPSLPHDACLINGAGHQVILLIPSLDIILVRLGHLLDEKGKKENAQQALKDKLLRPFMATLAD